MTSDDYSSQVTESTVQVRPLDVAIVGGGVAGASVAAALAGSGFGVAVIERELQFRDRVRGESIHPWGLREIDRLGLLEVLRSAGGNPLPVWQGYEDRVPREPYLWANDTPDGHGEFGIFHPAMQQALLDHAQTVGATVFRPARVVAFRGGDRPELDLATESGLATIRARLVIGADGRTSAARRWVGATSSTGPVHHSVGGCLLDGVALDSQSTHEATSGGVEALVFPQGSGRVRAYLMCGNERAAEIRAAGANGFISALAARFPDGAFSGATAAGPAAFFPNADIWPDRIAGDRVVLVGDAAGANDPSIGQGLSLTFRDARELRDLLVSDKDWTRAAQIFAEHRAAYYGVLREVAAWHARLVLEEGPDADARRDRAACAHEADSGADVVALICAQGPDEIDPDEARRRRYFGEV